MSFKHNVIGPQRQRFFKDPNHSQTPIRLAKGLGAPGAERFWSDKESDATTDPTVHCMRWLRSELSIREPQADGGMDLIAPPQAPRAHLLQKPFSGPKEMENVLLKT